MRPDREGAGRHHLGAVAAVVALLLLLTAAAHAPAAAAAPGLLVGATEDAFLWRGADAVDAARALGLGAIRVTVPWSGSPEPGAVDLARLEPIQAAAAAGLRVVVTVFSKAAAAPEDEASRDAFCEFTRGMLRRYPAINDVVIWNEANLGFYWQPQFSPDGRSLAPAAYEKLLARCWDVLHAFRPTVNVLLTTSPAGNDDPAAASNVSHSPGTFIRGIGTAYKASGRTKPIFDTIGHNPYGMSSRESPWRQHLTPSHIAEADLDRLLQALADGFAGTAQPVPGHCFPADSNCPSIWYLEAGYQTEPGSAHQSLYTGRENDAQPVPDTGAFAGLPTPTQSTQLTDGIELAYCQPYVGAFFNFLLWDETDLARWQSGVFWPDGTPKHSQPALQNVIEKTNNSQIDCRQLRTAHGEPTQRLSAPIVDRLEWPTISQYSSFNEIWRFAIETRTDATYTATIRRLGVCPTAPRSACRLTVKGHLRHGKPQLLQFPRQRLAPGTYQIEIVLSGKARGLTETRRAPAFRVT